MKKVLKLTKVNAKVLNVLQRMGYEVMIVNKEYSNKDLLTAINPEILYKRR